MISSRVRKRSALSSRIRAVMAAKSLIPNASCPVFDHSPASSSSSARPIAWISLGESAVVVCRATAAR